ncbi:MAG: electron transport complex protein RnfC [Eubacteriales bacterium]|nr:electron transport complex protein RnfC [Eubacteriales bacterium]
MSSESIRNLIKDAGVVGAGGAGFPTHVKLNCKAEVVIANGAECEPILRVDQQLMEREAKNILRGLSLAMEASGAKKGVVATKSHYFGAVAAIKENLRDYPNISLHLMRSYYPAGDEKSLIYEVTKRVVPTSKLPADVGVVVSNVNSLLNIAQAVDGRAVTKKIVTVSGEVNSPATYEVPIGTDAYLLLTWTGIPLDIENYILLVGGPCMGRLTENLHFPITKTTGGLILLPKTHQYVLKRQMPLEKQIVLARACCCQCSQCTQMCPRNALGLNVQPHKAMRAIAQANGKLVGDPNAVLACCSCGICTNYACNFGLNPANIMAQLKIEFAKQGLRPQPEQSIVPDPAQEMKKVPVSRMIARMGLKKYDVPAPQKDAPAVSRVIIPLRQHIGAPSEPIVQEGSVVAAGDLIAMIPEKALGANIHASISGRVVKITSDSIELEA